MPSTKGGRMSNTPSPAPEALAAVPPTAVSGAMLFGVSFEVWVQIATLAYLAGAIIVSLPRIIRAVRDLKALWCSRRE